MSREKMIIEVIAWNLNQDDFDTDGGEQAMIGWIIDTYNYLRAQSLNFLREHQYANSLRDEYEEGLDNGK
jgi:hypothetical protein